MVIYFSNTVGSQIRDTFFYVKLGKLIALASKLAKRRCWKSYHIPSLGEIITMVDSPYFYKILLPTKNKNTPNLKRIGVAGFKSL